MDDSLDNSDSFIYEVEDEGDDQELLKKLFNDQIDDEETLFALAVQEQLPQLALKRHYTRENRFDIIRGVLNIMRRLLHIDDNAINQWMGIDSSDDSEPLCILSFVFRIIDEYYERLCVTEMVEYKDMCFSLYDYLCSIICSFVMTLNEEQLNIAEEVLLENIFSSNLVCALLASDVICFMCRTCQSTFTDDISYVIFTLLIEIYGEDVQIREESTIQSSFLSLNLSQEILLNLLNRLLTFMDDNELELMKKTFPLEDYPYIWKMMQCGTKGMTGAGEIDPNEERFVYDKLCLIVSNDNATTTTQLSTSLIDNFVKTHDEYHSLLCLRLLANMKPLPQFNCSQMSDILKRVKQIFSSTVLQYRKQFVFPILRILNLLNISNDSACQSQKFLSLLQSVLMLLHEEVQEYFPSRQYYFSVLQNISMNHLFGTLVRSVASQFRLKRQFKLHIRHYKHGKFMAREEREIYISDLKKLYYNLPGDEDIDTDAILADAFLSPFNYLNLSKRSSDDNDEYSSCKRIKQMEEESEADSLIDAVQSTVLCNKMQQCIDMCREIHTVTGKEHEKLVGLSIKLAEHINNLVITTNE